MVHIIVFILKSIGILLLILLALFLIVLCLFLFVPFRYEAEASFYGKPKARAGVTWLFHLLSVQIQYDTVFTASIKVFGRALLREVASEEEGKKEVEHVAEQTTEGVQKAVETLEESIVEEEPRPISVSEQPQANKEEPNTDTEERNRKERNREKGNTEEGNIEEGNIEETQFSHEKQVQKKVETSQNRQQEEPETSESIKQETALIRILRRFQQKIQAWWRMVQRKWQSLCRQWQEKRVRIQNIRIQLEDAENQKMIRLIWRQGKHAIRHVLPRKIQGSLIFGFEDPYLMGQILAVVALFYPIYREQLKLTPMFDMKCLEGELALRGRVQMGVLLVLSIRLLFNKRIRLLIKKLMR